MVHAMAKGFTDMIAGRLDIVRSGEGAFRALEKRREAGPSPRAEAERRKAEAEAGLTKRHQLSNSNGSRIAARRSQAPRPRLEVVYALIEWPSAPGTTPDVGRRALLA